MTDDHHPASFHLQIYVILPHFTYKYTSSCLISLTNTRRRLSVRCMREDDDYRSVTKAGWWLSVSYIRQDYGYLSAIWWRMTIMCPFHEADWRLSVSYMRQDDGYVSVTWGRLMVICQLHKAEWRLSVSYMRQVGDYLSAAWSRIIVISQL
jgi:hypothetical protein